MFLGGNNWRAATRWLGIGLGTLLCISGIFVRTHPPDAPSSRSSKKVSFEMSDTKSKIDVAPIPNVIEVSGQSTTEPREGSNSLLKCENSYTVSNIVATTAVRSHASFESSNQQEHRKPSSRFQKAVAKLFDPVREPLKTPYFRCFMVYSLFVMISFSIPMIHIPPWVEDNGAGEAGATRIVSILGCAQVVGRICHGFFADRYGTLKYV